MSRIGKAPIFRPENVKVTFSPPNLTVEGPKGSLQMSVLDAVKVEQEESQIRVSAVGMSRKSRAFQGLTRSLLNEEAC